ncbi:MAG: hypothetical protein B6242_11765 [Anaerolineaceae bacterium 4572_78]|nr:MAG: hypothetical protein B6242_11765 [Anaerolineaceae bacterium 4572_78]
MARIYVSLDLETTGLDPKTDKIIEVGAIRFRGSRVLDEYQTFVNPNRHIPSQIQQLTGIKPIDVAHAPTFPEIEEELRSFVKDNPIIGHYIKFDLGFLRNRGLFYHNASIDTFEIASILLPHAGRYSLGALATLLNIEEPATHRALDDARVAHRLFEALLEQARRLDGRIIREVAQLATHSQWTLAPIFTDLSRERGQYTVSALAQQLSEKSSRKRRIFQGWDEAKTLNPIIPPKRLDVDQLASLLEVDGKFQQYFAQFEHRPQQVMMLRGIAKAFNHSHHVAIEAGTGTGKSIAYLIPAIYWAVQNGMRVVISTNTINLQDQILKKDLPDLKKILDIDFKAVALKGRGNYVCQWRVEQMQTKGSLFMPDFAEKLIWNQVNANSDICPHHKCAHEGCFFAQARHAAETAHVIVVNHALLLADIAVNNRVIPEYYYLIIDEAHHLENSITNQLSFSAGKKYITQLFNDLGNKKKGLFKRTDKQIKQTGQIDIINKANSFMYQAKQVSDKASRVWENLFQELEIFIKQRIGRIKSKYDQKLRITAQLRGEPAWNNLEYAWENANTILTDLIKLIKELGKLWEELDTQDIDGWEGTMTMIIDYRTQLTEIQTNVNAILSEEDKDLITWATLAQQPQDISLHAAPLHVGPLMRTHLFETKDSIVMTSATIRTDNSFEYFKERLSGWDIKDLAVGSPFDYKQSTLIYIPTDIPEPNSPHFQHTFNTTLVDLAIAIGGRILVLFTSYSQLRGTAQYVQPILANHDIFTYQQGAGASRRQLLENFKKADKAILLGTRSFWEGVDIPGPSLSCVMIAKIPFAVPNDPIVQARSETFDNPFVQYSIPEAILQFQQGFGRLIRTRTDRGVVVIMDRRVISKSYGHVFLESLPTATLKKGVTTDLPDIAARWINM